MRGVLVPSRKKRTRDTADEASGRAATPGAKRGEVINVKKEQNL